MLNAPVHMSDTPAPEVPPVGKTTKYKRKSLYMGLAAAVVLGGVGGGAWWTLRAAPVEHKVKVTVAAHKRGMVTFEPFVVNLADRDASRFLRVTVRLVVDSPERAKEVEETPVVLMGARSAILELLTTQTASTVVTLEGKAALRTAIAERVGHSGELEVIDVLFSDFVVQF